MKKNNIFKAIIATFVLYVVLSWILPSGTITSGVYTKGELSPVGIASLFIYPISTLATSIFAVVALIILLIGALYGVMNKTGAYQTLVEGIADKFKGKEKVFLVVSIVLFALLASLTTLSLPLLVVVPLFVAVILTLGFNKMTAMLSTVGAILVGSMATMFGYIEGDYNYINYFFGLKTLDNIAYKVILFVLLTALLIVYVIKTSNVEVKKAKKSTKKKEAENEEVVIPLYKKAETKKSAFALVVVLCLTVVVGLVSLYGWGAAMNTKTTVFDTFHNNISNVKVNDFAILTNLFGVSSPLGHWSNYEFAMVIVIAIILIGFIYNLKVEEVLDASVEGAKEMLAPALVAALAGILLLVVNSVNATFFPTIFNRLFHMTKGLNAITLSAVSVIGSVAYSQFPYLCNTLVDPVTSLYSAKLAKAVFIMQTMFGFAMLVVPTSATLVFGLQFLGISYKEWLKENWKLLLSTFVIALAFSVIIVLI